MSLKKNINNNTKLILIVFIIFLLASLNFYLLNKVIGSSKE